LPDVGVEKKRGVEEFSSVFDRVIGNANEKTDLTLEFEEGHAFGDFHFPGVHAPVVGRDESGNIAVTVSFSVPDQSAVIGAELQIRHTTTVITGTLSENNWNQARILANRDAVTETGSFNVAWAPGTYMFRYRSVDSGKITYSPSIVSKVAPEIEAHRSSSSSSLTLPNSDPPPLFRTHRLLCQPFTTLDTANTGDSFEVVAIGSGQSQINTLRLKENAGTGQFFVPVSGGIDGKVLDLGDLFEVEVEAHVETATLNDQEDSSYQVKLLVYKSDEPYYPEDQLFLLEDDSQMLQENDSVLMNDVYQMAVKPIEITGRKVITGRRFRFAFLVQKLNQGASNANGVPIFKELEVRIYARYRVNVVNNQTSNIALLVEGNYKTHKHSYSPLAPDPALVKYNNTTSLYESTNAIYVGKPVTDTDTVTSTSINMNVTQGVPNVIHSVKAMTEGNRYAISDTGFMSKAAWEAAGWVGATSSSNPAVNDVFVCKTRPRVGLGRVKIMSTLLPDGSTTASTVPKGKHYIVGIFDGSTAIACDYSIEAVGYGKTVFPNS
jgi:hypothetical protein